MQSRRVAQRNNYKKHNFTSIVEHLAEKRIEAENHRAKGGFTPLIFRRVQSSPPDERKEGDSMVTYSDLIQTEIFIVALVGLCYTIFKGKKK